MKLYKIVKAAVFLLPAALCGAVLAGMPADEQNAAESVPAVLEAAAQAMPAPAPAPSPPPDPQPLRIAKQALSFAELAPTTTMTFAELAGDNGVYEDGGEIPPLPPADTYKLVIDEYWQIATVYARDENGAYTVPVRYMIVSTGDYDTPTPKGTFSMGGRFVRFGYFSLGVYGQYWRQISGAIYTHSVLYLRRDANSYTGSYSRLGRRGSHGCVRLPVPDARWIYYNLAPGAACDIIRGDPRDETAAAVKAQLVLAARPSSRPGLKPGEIPVTEAWPGWQGNAFQAYQAFAASRPADTASG